jgi:hypothetical protein
MSDVNIIAESTIFFLTDIILNENDSHENEINKNNRRSCLNSTQALTRWPYQSRVGDPGANIIHENKSQQTKSYE